MRGRTLGLSVLGVVVLGVVIRMLWLCPGRTEKGPLHQPGFQAKRPGLRPPPVCKAGDTTPPTELVKQVPRGKLHSPYPDYMKLAEDDPDLVKQFRLPGCNECHGGSGGGGICPALTQGFWLWGNTDDVLFRLITLGSVDLEKEGYKRCTRRCRRWGRPSRRRTSCGRSLPSSGRSILRGPILLRRSAQGVMT